MASNGDNPDRRRALNLGGGRRFALVSFAAGSALVGTLAAMPDYGRSVVPGRMVAGHETLACTKCHAEAPGTLRQQVRANVLHWASLRETGATFGHEAVSAGACRDCHARDNDRHPSFRFREPRFQGVNRTLDARNCLTCHSEHKAERVSNDGTFCVACHDGMKARKELIQPTHAALSRGGRWDTCLTCHDFHGNHPVKAPRDLDEAHGLSAVRAYLADGADPYSRTKTHPAKDPAAARQAEALMPELRTPDIPTPDIPTPEVRTPEVRTP